MSAFPATSSPTAAAPGTWLSGAPCSPQSRRVGRAWAGFALLAFGLLAWFVVPHGIGVSWRECDTQAIARNFLVDGFDPLRPRIDWRGDTDGAVECEFPLYQLMVASVLSFVGQAGGGGVEWPGRLISLLAMLWAGWSVHRLLELRAGPGGAIAGLLTFLGAGATVMTASRIMPDALSLSLGVASLGAFARFLASGSSLTLMLSMTALAFAGLQKPLSLQVGWMMFGWTLLLAPRRLREPRLWLGWSLVVGIVLAWMLHGKSLYEETGLTFGVLAGGDTKFPNLDNLLSPSVHAHLAWTTVQFGLSGLGILAGAFLLLRRRLDAGDAVVLASVAAGLYVSLRYSYHEGMGPHYHGYAAFAGAWCVARVWPPRASVPLWGALVAVAVAQFGWRLHEERVERSQAVTSNLMDIAASIRALTDPTESIIIRGAKQFWDETWERRNNYEEPALFYQTGLQGWVLPVDGFGVAELKDLKRRGARLVYDCIAGEDGPSQAWLAANSVVLLDEGGVRLHRLRGGE
ncbi:MAG: ArnT family glycosyltransferase [Planctomycetota bacterium]